MFVFWCCFCLVGVVCGWMELCGWAFEEDWRWGRLRFRIWVWREDEEMLSWFELNGGVVGMTQIVLLSSTKKDSKYVKDFISRVRGMKWRLVQDGLVVVKEEWDFSSLDHEMKNGEWRDAKSSWVEFESRDPFPLLHAFSLLFFMIRGVNNAYPPFEQNPSCFRLNVEFKRQ